MSNPGTGITVFVGENGCGKTSILEALALPVLSYKTETFGIDDINDPTQWVSIKTFSSTNFQVASSMPNGDFPAQGFEFSAWLRTKGNKAYLSSIVVTDQQFMKPDGADKPKDGSPDLRVNVNNPFKGQRFGENDFLFLDKNRTFQTRSGTYNTTRFDRLMDDLNYQYLKIREESGIKDIEDDFTKDVKAGIGHDLLRNAIDKFEEISGYSMRLNLIDNWKPFSEAFFAFKKDNNQQIKIDSIGSGYEMIFCLVYSFYLSQQSWKQLIAFIDEPELHLHPTLQKKFVDFILEASKTSQIFLTTHAPLLVKDLLQNEKVKVKVINKDGDNITLHNMATRVMPYVSSNEVNYLAFGVVFEEFHNELYWYLTSLISHTSPADFDFKVKTLEPTCPIKLQYEHTNGTKFDCTLCTYIRHQIHHPENKKNTRFKYSELQDSIWFLVSAIRQEKIKQKIP